MSLFKREVWPFDVVLLVCCAFVFLTMGAMALYPGGTSVDPHSQGYHFTVNFFSDLGRTVAKNGEPNPYGSKLFFVSLASAGAVLGLFSIAFARFLWGSLLQRVATTAGVAFGLLSAYNFVCIALFPSDLSPLHIHYVYKAFEMFPLAVLCFCVAMTLSRTYPRQGLGVFLAFLVALCAYLTLLFKGPNADTAQGLFVQAVGQKLVVYASLLCVSLQSLIARRHLSAKHQLETLKARERVHGL